MSSCALVGFILIINHHCIVMNYLKLINAQQAKVTHTYKNTKENLYRTNAAIWFNKLCRSYDLTPNYIDVTINGYNKQCHNIMQSGVRLADNKTTLFWWRYDINST
jgi:hypothetical protein